MSINLIELRKQAEQAVHDMPDGELKVKAFETILTHLLALQSGTARSMKTTVSGREIQSPQAKRPRQPTSCGDRIVALKADGFFAPQRSIEEVRQELKKNGWHYPVTSLSGPLQKLVQRKELRRERTTDAAGRVGWKYSNP